MSNFSTGVETVIKRMETNPSEFFSDAYKWNFIFNDRFTSVLAEPEKDALQEALKAVRRKEFDHAVMQTLLHEETITSGQEVMRVSSSGSLGINSVIPKASLQIGKQTLSEGDIAHIKASTLTYNAKDRYSFK